MKPLPLIATPQDLREKYNAPFAFIIDNSSLEHWQLCRKLYFLSHLEKRTLAVARAGRNFGSTIHQALAQRYRAIGHSQVTKADEALMNSAMFEWLREHPQPTGDFRNYDHACKVVAKYNETYPFEPFRILRNSKDEPFVESSFAFPFDVIETQIVDPINHLLEDVRVLILWAGRIDLAINQDDSDWSFDTKTAFMFGDQWRDDLAQNGGQIGYCWAFKQVFGRKPRGYIINGIRVRKPSRKSEYEGVAPVDNTDFVRVPFEISEDNIEEWREDVLALINEIFDTHLNGFFPRCRKACVTKYGRCDFYDCCSLPRAQRDIVLSSTLYEENTWTPLNKAE